ncbi:hypothetical protein CLOSTASPAR_03415 [[Clostridium] asparagiforme DSM 15981]|uniref:Uncharacterized protein n=1 Tax=[Clostridium] asparagiforme DSM 15981 TaxID=518636 RepID=C0D2C6_9FIRM|nr:hypothetical protein CLOSTASPAR_03415 [[Clostridium] asparagiforme DSM 15981]
MTANPCRDKYRHLRGTVSSFQNGLKNLVRSLFFCFQAKFTGRTAKNE